MSLYSSKLVGVVMMADETRTSYMTQREGVWYICKSVCMCKVCVRCVYMCAHTHTGDKGTGILREIPPQMSHVPTPWRRKDPGSQGNLGSPSTPDHEGKP